MFLRPPPSVVRFPPRLPKNYAASPEAVSTFFLALFFLLLPTGRFIQTGEAVTEYVFPPYVAPGYSLPDIGVLFAVLALNAGRKYFKRTHPLPIWIILPLLIPPFLGALTASGAIEPPLALWTCLRWAAAPMVFVLLWECVPKPEKIAGLFVLSLSVQAAIAIAQAVSQSPLGLPGELLIPPSQAGAPLIHAGGLTWLRASGLSFHPNVLGGLLAVGLVIGLPFVRRWPGRASWWLMAIGLPFTFSRSAGLVAAVILPLAIFWLAYRLPEMRKPLLITVGAAVAAALAAFLVTLPFTSVILSRLQPFSSLTESVSVSGRGEMITIALDLIRQSPWKGVGAGNFPLAMLPYPTVDSPHYVHHVPLLLASEVGLIGGLAWYWLWLYPLAKGLTRLNETDPWPVMGALAVLAFGLIALFDSYPWALASGRYAFTALLALLAVSLAGPAHVRTRPA